MTLRQDLVVLARLAHKQRLAGLIVIEHPDLASTLTNPTGEIVTWASVLRWASKIALHGVSIDAVAADATEVVRGSHFVLGHENTCWSLVDADSGSIMETMPKGDIAALQHALLWADRRERRTK